MSTGFRHFLLTLLAFVVVWISRYRREDIAFWLGAPRGIDAALQRADSGGSPVPEVLPGLLDVEIRSPEVQLDAVPADERPAAGWTALYGDDRTSWSDPSPEPEAVSGEVYEEGFEEPEKEAAPPGESQGMEEAAEVPPPAALEPSLYVVQPGDNLSKIARKLLGKERRYREILELNRDLLKGSTLILPGMELRIPAP